MFQFIRKHQAIGLIFIGVVIVSFVIFFSPNQRGAGGMPRGALGTINGRPIERGEYVAAAREAALSYFFRQGDFPVGGSSSGWDEGRQTVDRLFLLEEARQQGITVTDEVAAERIMELPFLKDPTTQRFNQAGYDQFLAFIRNERGLSRADFEEFMRNEVALQHLVQVVGLSGTLVTPREAEARYRAAHDQFAGQLVTFSATNHYAEVDLGPENVGRYFTNHLAEYRIPERVQVRYVKFATTNFLVEADQQLASRTNLDQTLEVEYQRRGADSFKDSQGNLLSAEAAKTQMKEQFRDSLALEAARKAANAFANRLYQQLDPEDPSLQSEAPEAPEAILAKAAEAVTRLATEAGLSALTSAAFERTRPPQDMRVPATMAQAAFALSSKEPFATPVMGEDGVYVFALDRRVPAEYPQLELVRARVIDSLRRSEARALAEAAGRAFAASVTATNLTAQGKTFEEAAAAAGFHLITLTNFSQTTRTLPETGSRLTVGQLLQVANDLKVGETSPFTPAMDGGFVLHLTARTPVSDEEVKEKVPEFLSQLRQFGRFPAFSEWEQKRFAAADVRLPGVGTASPTNAAPASAN